MQDYISEMYIRTTLLDYFNENSDKVELWLNTDNPILGGVSPNKLIKLGRARKLADTIDSILEGDIP